MADRRLLEDGSRRLQEDGSYRLLEQQSAIGVSASITEADDTLSASVELVPVQQPGTGQPARRRRGARQTYTELAPPTRLQPRAIAFRLLEDDDVCVAELAVVACRREIQNRRAMDMLLLA